MANLIRDARKALKLTQADMAEALGLSQPSISRFERNPDSVDARTRMAVQHLLSSINPPHPAAE